MIVVCKPSLNSCLTLTDFWNTIAEEDTALNGSLQPYLWVVTATHLTRVIAP